MQNNVTELTQKLLNSLDSNYNVIDMPSVVEIISLLETVAITKDILETTRLGRHINNLRRNTKNESLAKSAKGLLKKWRNAVLPESNGQLKQTSKDDVNLNELRNRKRPPKDNLEHLTTTVVPNIKRTKLNGTNEFDFSDNSNSSFKDAINSNSGGSIPDGVILSHNKNVNVNNVVVINSDSNSSIPDIKTEPVLEQPQPKKRGRKKGSGNHKNLIDEAETSFTNKMAVSRGNAKVKTTQELIASLQSKKNNANLLQQKDNLSERAALLTERVSIIDQKLNTNSNRVKNANANKKLTSTIKNELSSTTSSSTSSSSKNDKVIESGVVVNVTPCPSVKSDDEIIVDDDDDEDDDVSEITKADSEDETKEPNEDSVPVLDPDTPRSLSVAEVLKRLPPLVVKDDDDESELNCICTEEDEDCMAKKYLSDKYRLSDVNIERVKELHDTFIPCVNGNVSIGYDDDDDKTASSSSTSNNLYANVVPNVNNERIPKSKFSDRRNFTSENYKKYSISDCCSNNDQVKNVSVSCAVVNSDDDDGENEDETTITTTVDTVTKKGNKTFREWHELVETTSYNGEILKILPYVIID